MDIVASLEKIAHSIKERRLSNQITNDELRVYVERLRPLMDKARKWEEKKAKARQGKIGYRKSHNALMNVIQTYRTKSSIVYWSPSNPSTIIVMRWKKGYLTTKTHTIPSYFDCVKGHPYHHYIMLNAKRFWKMYFQSEDYPHNLHDFNPVMAQRTIGGREPYELMKVVSRNYEALLGDHFRKSRPLEKYKQHLILGFLYRELFDKKPRR